MTASMFIGLVVAVVVPLAFYVRDGWRDERKATATAGGLDFFAAARSLSVSQYAITTVAYGLQMAAVVLFAVWGYTYGYWSFLVPLSWFLGFALLAALAGRLDAFLKSERTLHGFLGVKHDGSAALVRIAAFATVLGLGGTLFVELRYVSDLIQHLMGREVEFRYFLTFFFLAAVLAYVLPGGFRAVVATDTKQLPLGYLGLAVLLSAIVHVARVHGRAAEEAALIGSLSFAAIAGTVVFNVARARGDRQRVGEHKLGAVVPLIAATLIAVTYLTTKSDPTVGSNLTFDDWEPTRMTWLVGVSLLLANGLWQVVDLSAFQRLTALELPDDAEQRHSRIRRAIMWTAMESPLSWCVGIGIGVGLGRLGAFGGADGAWTAYEQFLLSISTGEGIASVVPEAWRVGILSVVMMGIVSVMLSTVDSYGSAVALTTTTDVIGGGATTGASSVGRARAVTIAALGAIWVVFAGWEYFLSDAHDIGGWLYIAYAMQLSLFGVAFAAFLNKPIGARWAVSSVASGIVGSLVVGIWLALKESGDLYVLPPIVAVVASALIVAAALAFGRSHSEGD